MRPVLGLGAAATSDAYRSFSLVPDDILRRCELRGFTETEGFSAGTQVPGCGYAGAGYWGSW
jgi:hypothetical protein